VHRRFLGEVDRVELAIDGIDGLLQARIRSDLPHGSGTDVRIWVRPDDVLVFPAETA